MLQKRLMDDMKTQGRLQRTNPFKEIEGKEYNKKYYNKQKELLEKFSKEIQQGNQYLDEFSNINDETGLKRAYDNRTDLGLYHHPENKTLYIAGTKDFPRDILDDALIPFHMVHRSKRYRTANNFIRNNIDNVDNYYRQPFLGFCYNDEVEPRLQQKIYHQNLRNADSEF